MDVKMNKDKEEIKISQDEYQQEKQKETINELKNNSKKAKEDFENMVENYLASNPVLKKDNKTNEFEIRFGSNSKLSKPISKIDYDNVIKKLKSLGFNTVNSQGFYALKIESEFLDLITTECIPSDNSIKESSSCL
jgi:hypothetical protein